MNNDTQLRSIMDLSAEEWLAALRLSQDSIPDAVIVEGSWCVLKEMNGVFPISAM